MKNRTSRKAGFTLVEIMIVVAIIGLLATAVAVPGVLRAQRTANKQACILNLRNIDGAIKQFKIENKKADTDPVTLNDVHSYLEKDLVCPSGGTTMNDSYNVSDCQTPPTCVSRGGGESKGHVLDK